MAPYSYDESEQTWSQLVSEVLYDLDSGDNAHIQYPGLLIVSKPGSFTVSARAHDQNDEDKYYNIAPAQIKVGGEQYLSAIEFDDAAFAEYQGLELSGVGDEIVIRDLKNKIRFCDKYGDPWTGEKPEVVFSYEYGDAPNKDYEVVDNNEFHIRKPGTINLWLNSGDFVDHVEIDIRDGTNMEDMDNLVISLTDPGDIILDGSGTETDLDIERFVEYKTLLGGKWEGIIPELSFELDQAGSGAKLESRTEVISKKDEELRTREYTSFVTKTPGSYTIHVAAKNAAQYSGKIGDLVLRVKGTSKLNIKTKSVRIKRGKSAKIKYSSTPKGAAVKFKNKSSKAVKKVIKLSSNGRIKVSKKAKKGKTYKVKVMATYAGNSKYTSARTAVKTIKVKVK